MSTPDSPEPPSIASTQKPTPSRPILNHKDHRYWKEKFRVVENLKFLVILLIPIFCLWLCFLPTKMRQPTPPTTTIPPPPVMATTAKAKPVEIWYRFNIGLFIMLVVGFYWITDCMPMPAAGLVPLVLIPLLKVGMANSVMFQYMTGVTMTTFGCSLLALSCVESGISKRIAHKILEVTGGDFRRILLVASLIAALMSMWFMNCTVMLLMLDVVDKVVQELKDAIHLGSMGDQRITEWKAANLEHESSRLTQKQETSSLDGDKPTAPKQRSLGQIEGLKSTESVPTELKVPNSDEMNSISIAENPESLASESERSMMSNATQIASLIEKDESFQKALPPIDDDKLAKLVAENDKLLDNFKIDLLHAIAVVGNIGGLFWAFCSTSSMALFMMKRKKDDVLDIGLWMVFTAPIIAVLLPLAFWYLDFLNVAVARYLKKNEAKYKWLDKENQTLNDVEKTEATKERLAFVYKNKYSSLGDLNSHEKGVFVILLVTVFALVFRDPVVIYGWSTEYKVNVQVSTIAILGAALVFILPKNAREMINGPTGPEDIPVFKPLLGWKLVQNTFPWGLLIFIGGGVAIAWGSEAAQLNERMECKLFDLLKNTNYKLILLLAMTITFLLANLVSNTTAAIMAISVFSRVATRIQEFQSRYSSNVVSANMNEEMLSLCYLTIPCVAVTSIAFLFPAGTPMLALAHMTTHRLNSWQCFYRGWPLALVCFLVIYLFGIAYTNNLMGSCVVKPDYEVYFDKGPPIKKHGLLSYDKKYYTCRFY